MESKKRKRTDNGNRLKVGRACYTCRAKKIKCDGLRPCMQCKAREIACSFYKDGSLETDSIDFEKSHCNTSEIETSKNSVNHPNRSSEQAIFFSENADQNHTKLKRKGPMMESRVSNMLASLGDILKKTPPVDGKKLSEKLWPPGGSFGNFITWTTEPPLPSRYSGSIEMPSAKVQLILIDHFFRTKHKVLQCIIPHYFYEQLEVKGLFITPLLLNSIYALSARFVSIPDCPKEDIFFHRAKRLMEDFMDVPRISTVIAAYLLSLYEPSAEVYRPGFYHCRHWSFSGMAFRMCNELGLYDENNVDPSLTHVEKELRRRVFWSCYNLDKFQSSCWERPWMIQQDFIRTKLPTPLPEENVEEQFNLKVFLQKIEFSRIMEDDLELKNRNRSSLYSFSEKKTSQQDICLLFTAHFNKYIDFFYSLPIDMMWIPVRSIEIKDILQLPKPSPVIAHFHLHFHVILIELLSKIPASDSNTTQLRIAATTITQLSYYLCQEPSHILKLDFIAHTLIHAIKIHMLHLEDPDITVVQQSWFLFYRCVYCLQQLNKYASIPNCHKFLQQVYHVYGLDISESYFNPNELQEKRPDITGYDTTHDAFINYTTKETTPIFQYHQPPQAYIQSDIWHLSKSTLPTVHQDNTLPSQLDKIQDDIFEGWPENNSTERQKPNPYLTPNNYNGIIDNYP